MKWNKLIDEEMIVWVIMFDWEIWIELSNYGSLRNMDCLSNYGSLRNIDWMSNYDWLRNMDWLNNYD